MVKIWNTDTTKFWQGFEVTGTLIHCSWGYKIVVTVEDSLVVSYKTKHTLTIRYIQTVTVLLGIYTKELEIYAHTKTCT